MIIRLFKSNNHRILGVYLVRILWTWEEFFLCVPSCPLTSPVSSQSCFLATRSFTASKKARVEWIWIQKRKNLNFSPRMKVQEKTHFYDFWVNSVSLCAAKSFNATGMGRIATITTTEWPMGWNESTSIQNGIKSPRPGFIPEQKISVSSKFLFRVVRYISPFAWYCFPWRMKLPPGCTGLQDLTHLHTLPSRINEWEKGGTVTAHRLSKMAALLRPQKRAEYSELKLSSANIQNFHRNQQCPQRHATLHVLLFNLWQMAQHWGLFQS